MTNDNEMTGVSIHAGFPNPATDASIRSLDLNRLLVTHSASTYFFRVEGSDWDPVGIFHDDIAIVDRALDPRKNDIVLWWNEADTYFALSRYKDMPQEATCWGVITTTIREHRKQS